ncbi:MAG TPA: BTAD domain-containing putative transcriptional regulator [Microlunatus sp.]|nr:BTAD domain-containing putative transcriptional regulator [Microlunatus sp.]
MFVRLLGPVAAGPRSDDVAPVAGQISAAVLAQLALAEGRWVSSDALVDAVWDEPPGSARNAIQVAVSKLRKQLRPDLVLSSAHGYALDASAVTTDWQQAARLVVDSRRQLDLGDPPTAADRAAAALELFRGEPLLGLTSRSAGALRRSADELLSTARELRARALLAMDRPDEAAAAIQPTCETDPLNEPAQAIRIEALAAAGRLAAALAGYHQLRRALAEEMGVDPSPATQALFHRLLASRDTPPPETPSEAGERNDQDQPTRPQLTFGLAPSRATAYQPRAVRERLPTLGTVVLTGLSGVGKTQVAAGVFADSAHPLRIWVSASSTSAIISAYADAADTVQRVDSSRPDKDRARQFLAWLASTTSPWLVVLDDVTDPADLRGWWPPESRYGLVLATTQRRIAELSGEGREVFDVGLYSEAESLAYLRQRLRTTADRGPDTDLAELAGDLGHHPLALGLAAAVIIDEASTVAGYGELLRTAPLSASLPSDVRADGYPRSLQAAWQIALERADRLSDKAASRLLEVLSVLDPAGAPEALLDARAVQQHLASRSLAPHVDEPRPRTVLRALHQVSLTDHEPSSEPRSIRTHALTGRLARERASTEQVIAALRVAADALVESWPEFPTSKIAETLRSNASTVEQLDRMVQHRALWRESAESLPALLALHGRSLMDAEQFTAALPYLESQRFACAERLGDRHLHTIKLHNDLARARSLSGDPGQARSDLTTLLADLQRSLGNDHPGTLITAMTRAGIGVEAGSPLLAIQEIEAILPRLEQVLGHDHEVTLSALQDLANAYGESGDDRAIGVYDDLIERWHDLVGEDHRRTVILRADRAYWLGHIGDAAASEEALRQLLPQLERVLGPLDPNTLRARNNRAYFLTDHAAAFEEFSRLLTVRLEVLGPDHSDTLATRGNLANRRGMLGDPAGAAEDFASVVADQERVLGRENRFALLCRGYQARWLIEAGATDVGLECASRAVADLERVLGPDHPYSRRITSLLADLRV